MAICSYLIDRLQFQDGDDHRWTEHMERNCGVHADWIKCLKETQVCDLNPETTARVGSFVTPGCDWLDDVPMMIRSGIPLWFRWNKNQKETFAGTIVDQYRPQIFDPRSPTEPGPLRPHSPSYNTLAPAGPKFPKPYQGSRQRMGESWEEFFCRRDKRRLVMEAAESEQARRSRLDWE
jgi:hypothetical protein